MSKKAVTKTKSPKLTGAWRLWRASLADLFGGWKIYFGAMLILALPIALLSFSATLAADAGFVAYSSLAALVLNLVIFSIAIARYRQQPATIRGAYYDGTATLIRFFIICVVLGLCLLPAILGLTTIGLAQQDGAGLSELIVIGLLGLVLAIPSFWLLLRFGLGAVMMVDQPGRPFAVMAAARRLTLGRFWAITGRLVILILWLVIVALIVTLLVTLLAAVYHNNAVLNSISRLLLSITVLPLGCIYLVRLYGQLYDESAQ